jgi:hypothetical protein
MKKKESGIVPVNALFAKYQTLLKAPQGTIITTACEVIQELLMIQISKESVRYNTHSKILSIRVLGPQKSEIILHKNDILRHITGRVGKGSAPKDIL